MGPPESFRKTNLDPTKGETCENSGMNDLIFKDKHGCSFQATGNDYAPEVEQYSTAFVPAVDSPLLPSDDFMRDAISATHSPKEKWSDVCRRLRYDQRNITFVPVSDGGMVPVHSQSLIREDLKIRDLHQLSVISQGSKTRLERQKLRQHNAGQSLLSEIPKSYDTATHTSFAQSNATTELEVCQLSALRYIQLVKSKQWPFSKCDDVAEELDLHDENDIARDIVTGWKGKAVQLALYGEGWAEIGAKMLPEAADFGKEKGLYLDFLSVPLYDSVPAHCKAYGGMASGVDGLYGRIRQHESTTFRNNHPSFHYRIKDLPGTKSTICAFATYPKTRSRGFLLLAEGFQIAIFGLYESDAFLRYVSVLGMPAVTGQKRIPVVGVNNDSGLQFQGWDSNAAERARDSKDRQKAMELVTTGYPVSILRSKLSGRQKTGHIRFQLMHSHIINVSAELQKRYAQLQHHKTAIIFIHLSAGKIHSNPWYNCTTQRSVLQQFGIWLQLKNDIGFWLQVVDPFRVRENATSKREKKIPAQWTLAAEMIVQVYNIDNACD